MELYRGMSGVPDTELVPPNCECGSGSFLVTVYVVEFSLLCFVPSAPMELTIFYLFYHSLPLFYLLAS